jgi:hypothetical protein
MSGLVVWLAVIPSVFVLLLSANHNDAGNRFIKAKIVRREHGEVAFPHAKNPLTETVHQHFNPSGRKRTSTGLFAH